LFPNCSTCVNAPQKDGKSQCGWSEFLDSCIDGDTWTAMGNASLKAGWLTEEKDCVNEPPKPYCFQFTDCFSCAGVGGVQRRCQWSVKDNACKPYDPFSDFKTEANPQANNVIAPQLCEGKGCSEYATCAQCEQNAACLWPRAGGNCVAYDGSGTDKYYFYQSNCPAEASPSPSPSPLPCPSGCECGTNSKVVSCGGSQVKDQGFVRTDRATANAEAAASIEQVDSVAFNQAAGQFVVKGHTDGRLLFVIPVSVDVTASVNAQTGAVEKIERSWWSFLVG
jgi:hypothetical protein